MDFFRKIYVKYFSVNLNDYSNIGIDFEINKLLFFVAIGLCAACIFINYYQGNISVLLKKLIRLEAFSKDKSKTLKDIGLADHKPTKNLILKNSGIIKKVVAVVGRKTLTYEDYIAAEKQKKAAKRRLVSKVECDAQETSDSQKNSSVNEISSAEQIDFSVARLYIIPEMREYAEHSLKSGTSPIKTALYCVLILAFFVVLVLTMPSLLTLINNIMG